MLCHVVIIVVIYSLFEIIAQDTNFLLFCTKYSSNGMFFLL